MHFFGTLGALMFFIGAIKPRATDYVMPINENMDITPWEFRFEASAIVLYMVLGAFFMFSKVGLMSDDWTFITTYGICGVVMLFGIVLRTKRRSDRLQTVN